MSRYRHLHAPADGYVFVVTYGRSGSTLTQNLLNTIPGYAIRGENGNLTEFLAHAIDMVASHDMYRWRREDLPKRRSARRPYLRPILGKPHDPWAGAERVDPDTFALDLMNVFVKRVLRPPKDCRVAGFKEIRLHENPAFFRTHLDTLRRYFPNARILFQRRNLEDVAQSGWWLAMPRDEVVAQLTRADGLFQAYAQDHPDVCHLVDYEALTASSDHARSLFDFLREPLDEAVLKRVLWTALTH